MTAIRLACAVNNYHWGKHGLHSKAAQFYAASHPDAAVDAESTYAELWMGTHPNGPSQVYGTDTGLSEVIADNPEAALGAAVDSKYGGQLPFLFKVLSIEKALSIQAHPDKRLAQMLHAERPDVYKDANHKPEMSIALTDFVALSGFRPLEDIAAFLEKYPELRALTAASSGAFIAAASDQALGTDAKKKALRALFSELMNAPAEAVQQQLAALLARTQASADPLDTSETALAHRLSTEYPGDVGVFCVFLLNVLKLVPGDAFYMGPNDPHAYIFGDCIECMATSDNVVRAGLTPKLRDVPVLVDMLTYDYGSPHAKLLRPQPYGKSGHSSLYDPPIDEFAVVRSELPTGQTETIESADGPRILIVVEGRGSLATGGETQPLEPGFVYYVCPGTSIALEAEQPLVTYTAQCI
ncbi:Mannose-6-phosphate isomerase [Coemansia sp. RSA 552]|nr:Mannose-6-phosphate isomerase [Coemansia sp. RSA 552]